MDRVTILALVAAGVSVCLSVAILGDVVSAVLYGFSLLFPLAVIAFPEVLDFIYRYSWSGLPHSGSGPTPAIILRVAGWLLLIVLIVAHFVFR